MKKQLIRLGTILLVLAAIGILVERKLDRSIPVDPLKTPPKPGSGKLYWFIPDGLRAAGPPLDIFAMAERGDLPNLKRLLASSSYGYSIPSFPTHTPVCYSNLVTGALPAKHGVADGPMHLPGYPLAYVSLGGFSSIAKKIEPIWYTLEQQGKSVALLSMPGSTPPELTMGMTIRGRFGGWGPDFHAISYATYANAEEERRNRNTYQFNFGATLFENLALAVSGGRTTTDFVFWGYPIKAEIQGGKVVFRGKGDRVTIAELEPGQWSNWYNAPLLWQTRNDYRIDTPKRMEWERDLATVDVPCRIRIYLNKLEPNGNMKFRVIVENLNPYLVKPNELAEQFRQHIAEPMVDFPDNYPPQLVYDSGDEQTFLDELKMAMDWHRQAASTLLKSYPCDVILHSIYAPNQMLTSRWWMGAIDPSSDYYEAYDETERKRRIDQVIEMYRQVDTILGAIMTGLDEDSWLVFSSDHGAIPLNFEVRLNNYFAEKGWLRFDYDQEKGYYSIDFSKTKVLFLKMYHIYIDPDGLNGSWDRAGGPAYEALRTEVIEALKGLRDERGRNPLAFIKTHEQAAKDLSLPEERIGDLVVANAPGFVWTEDMSEDGRLFTRTFKRGYKQAVPADNVPGLYTPFVIHGPGIKTGYRLDRPIRDIDQYPTIIHLLDLSPPAGQHPDGEIVRSVFEQPPEQR